MGFRSLIHTYDVAKFGFVIGYKFVLEITGQVSSEIFSEMIDNDIDEFMRHVAHEFAHKYYITVVIFRIIVFWP